MSYASEFDCFVIKTYNAMHECERTNWCNDATAIWIARIYGSLIRTNPNIEAKILQEMIRTNQWLEVPKHRIYTGKRLALKSTSGDHKAAYAELHKYTNLVQKYNPGSFAFLKCSTPLDCREPIFECFYLSFATQIKGFIVGCRPYIRLDGCHLKGPYK